MEQCANSSMQVADVVFLEISLLFMKTSSTCAVIATEGRFI